MTKNITPTSDGVMLFLQASAETKKESRQRGSVPTTSVRRYLCLLAQKEAFISKWSKMEDYNKCRVKSQHFDDGVWLPWEGTFTQLFLGHLDLSFTWNLRKEVIFFAPHSGGPLKKSEAPLNLRLWSSRIELPAKNQASGIQNVPKGSSSQIFQLHR